MKTFSKVLRALTFALGVQAAANQGREKQEFPDNNSPDSLPKITQFPSTAEFQYILGVGHYQRGEAEKAIESFQAAIQIDPTQAVYFFKLAQVQIISRKGSVEDIVASLRKAIELDPTNGGYHFELAQFYQQMIKPYLELYSRRSIPISEELNALKQETYGKALEEIKEAVRLDPDNSDYHLELGRTYQVLGQYDEAAKSMLEAIKLFATNSDYKQYQIHEYANHLWHELSEIYEKTGNYEDAKMAIEEAIKLDPKNSRHKVRLSQIHMLMGNNERAITVLEESDKSDKFFFLAFPDAAKDLIRLYKQTENQDKLVSLLKSLNRLYPGTPEYIFESGNLYKQYNYDEARKLFEKAVELSPNNAQYQFELGALHMRFQKDQEALGPLRIAAKLEPNNIEYQYALAFICKNLRLYDEGLELIERVVKSDPGNPSYQLVRASILKGLGRVEESVEIMERMMKLYPDNPNNFIYKVELGRSYEESGKYQESIVVLEDALKSTDHDVVLKAKKDLSRIYRFFGRNDEVLKMLLDVLDMEKNINNTYELAAFYFSLGRDEEAKKVLLELVDIFPRDLDSRNIISYSRYTLGLIYTRQGYDLKAADAFSDAIRLNTNDARFYYEHGAACRRSGQNLIAKYSFEEAIKLDPENPRFHHALGDVCQDLYQKANSVKYSQSNKKLLLEALDHYQKALDHYQKSLELDQGNLELYKSAITCCYVMGKFSKAYELLQKAQEIDSTVFSEDFSSIAFKSIIYAGATISKTNALEIGNALLAIIVTIGLMRHKDFMENNRPAMDKWKKLAENHIIMNIVDDLFGETLKKVDAKGVNELLKIISQETPPDIRSIEIKPKDGEKFEGKDLANIEDLKASLLDFRNLSRLKNRQNLTNMMKAYGIISEETKPIATEILQLLKIIDKIDEPFIEGAKQWLMELAQKPRDIESVPKLPQTTVEPSHDISALVIHQGQSDIAH